MPTAAKGSGQVVKPLLYLGPSSMRSRTEYVFAWSEEAGATADRNPGVAVVVNPLLLSTGADNWPISGTKIISI